MTKGLYVQTLNGVIHSVQVEDSAGMQWPLDTGEYAARGHQPSINNLPTLETYTRDRYLNSISAAFNDAFTYSPSGSWQFIVESTPKREIVLMPFFVTRNIVGGAMQPSDLTNHLKSLPDSAWAERANGTLTIVLN